MQINALLRQVHHRVTSANDEADHKMEARLSRLIYKDLIQVSDKVLIHWSQPTMAQSSHLPWKREFTVTKTNDMMSQVENENEDKTWIHCEHIHRLAPWPTHQSYVTPPLPSYDTLQNTQDYYSPRTSGVHNSTKTSRPGNINPQQTQNERKKCRYVRTAKDTAKPLASPIRSLDVTCTKAGQILAPVTLSVHLVRSSKTWLCLSHITRSTLRDQAANTDFDQDMLQSTYDPLYGLQQWQHALALQHLAHVRLTV